MWLTSAVQPREALKLYETGCVRPRLQASYTITKSSNLAGRSMPQR